MNALLASLLLSVSLSPAPIPDPAAADAPAPSPTAAKIPTGKLLTLEAAMDEAREHNPDLAQTRARLEQAWEISKKAWAGYLPQVTVGGSYTYNNLSAIFSTPTNYYIRDTGTPQGPVFDPSRPAGTLNPTGAPTNLALQPSGIETVIIQKNNQWAGQGQVTQALIVPPLWAGIQSAYLAQHAAELNVENARREILFSTAQLYYGAASMKETVDVQQQLLEINRDRAKDAKVRYEAGAVNRVTLLRAEIDLARAEQELRRAEYSYASSRSALAAILDRQPDFEVASPSEPAMPLGTPESLERDAPIQRPDVLAVKAGVGVAEKNHEATWLSYFPSINFTARYQIANVTGFTGRPDAWALIVAANWTLFDGGLREATLRENAAKITEARAAHRSAENRVRDEVRRALYDLESARANRVKADEQRRLARETRELVRLNSDAGTATYLEVSDATANLLQAELTVVAETLNTQLSVLSLARAAGRWNP